MLLQYRKKDEQIGGIIPALCLSCCGQALEQRAVKCRRKGKPFCRRMPDVWSVGVPDCKLPAGTSRRWQGRVRCPARLQGQYLRLYSTASSLVTPPSHVTTFLKRSPRDVACKLHLGARLLVGSMRQAAFMKGICTVRHQGVCS